MHLSYIIHVLIVTRSRRHLVRAQMSKADGCRTNEQQKQQKQKQQKQQKQKHQKQKQQKQKQQKQTGSVKSCVSSLSPDPTGAASAGSIEARIPVI